MRVFRRPSDYFCSECGALLSLKYPDFPPNDVVVYSHEGNEKCSQFKSMIAITVEHFEVVGITDEPI